MTHHHLTASSLSPHPRKGREGKGRGREVWTEGPIHRFGSRGLGRDAWMAADAALGGVQ